jgi:hypothetical protein
MNFINSCNPMVAQNKGAGTERFGIKQEQVPKYRKGILLSFDSANHTSPLTQK